MQKNSYRALGMMSGTSLDGLDLALCRFTKQGGRWDFQIEATSTLDYPDRLLNQLATAQDLDGMHLLHFHQEYGRFLGKAAREFLGKTAQSCDLIASHGHTVFHKPELGLTFQAGSGTQIAIQAETDTVCDFRTQDVALGGQGAPLVPIGDKLLFSNYDYCLNLGGFSNISFDHSGKRVAFDPSPVNFVLNHLMKYFGKTYDEDGKTGRRGRIKQSLLKHLNGLEYYRIKGPKSLGREWVEKEFLPVIQQYDSSPEDTLRTVYEHIAGQITESIRNYKPGKVLVTGGGTHNIFLMELLAEKMQHTLVRAESEIIDYKEAVIFAFLGVLRIRNEINCLASVTGAEKDHSSGTIVRFPT